MKTIAVTIQVVANVVVADDVKVTRQIHEAAEMCRGSGEVAMAIRDALPTPHHVTEVDVVNIDPHSL